jgi:lipopolysaccharide export system permease protein
MPESHRVLNRYVVSEFLKLIILSLSSLTVIYTVVTFLQRVNLFIKYQAPIYLMFEYLLYKVLEVTLQWTLPYGVLLGTLLTLGMFSRHSEITAMKAGGISLYRISLPLLFIAFVISLISFLGNEYLLPFTSQRMQYLLDVKIKNERPSTFFKNYKIWHHGDHRIFNIQLLDNEKKILKGLTLYQIDDHFQCTQRIDAQEAKWMDGRWRLYDGAIRDFHTGGPDRTTPFKEMDFVLGEDWAAFQKLERKWEEMSYTELQTYIQKIRSSGYDPTRYLVALYAKISYPFLSVIMVLIGIPFALKTGRSGGVALSIGISVAIGFVFGVMFYLFLSLGKSGVLPPYLSAWTPTILFGLAGIFTLTSVRQ